MGAVMLGDVVSPSTGFSYTMLAGTAHQDQLRSAEAVYRPSRQAQSTESWSSHREHPADDAASRAAVRYAKSSRSSNMSVTLLQNLSVSDPIPVPRSRTDSQPSSVNTSTSERPDTTTQPILNQITVGNLYTRTTPPPPPHEPASAYRSRAGGQQSLGSSICVKVRDLAHIQQLARDEFLRGGSAPGVTSAVGLDDVGTTYDISAMSVTDVIEMVAGLLTKITTTNDRQHENLHRHVTPTDGAPSLNTQASSVLAFHGKNVPTITISSYLTRIHRYCPTTYEVFLGLLVYFDRMTERVNFGSQQQQQQQQQLPADRPDNWRIGHERRGSGASTSTQAAASIVTPPFSAEMEGFEPSGGPVAPGLSAELRTDTNVPPTQFFVVDSYNIHRLIIAGVTCASKFFSDVFYTNSRYAKVSFQAEYPYDAVGLRVSRGGQG